MDYTTYSDIDHIHFSSEAQCVSHLLPQVDCHIWYLVVTLTHRGLQYIILGKNRASSVYRLLCELYLRASCGIRSK